MGAKPVHVVAAVIEDKRGRLLLTQRPSGKHLAGLWEFPGGKCEHGESPCDALRRELREELGIEAGATERVIAILWHYPEKSILLEVLRVHDFAGTAQGLENQAIRWVPLADIRHHDMPPADRPVLNALKLPAHYVITPEPDADQRKFLDALDRVFASGERLVQLRCKRLQESALRPLALAAGERAARSGAQLLVNDEAKAVARLMPCGVHLPSRDLMRLDRRPLGDDRWVAASCHDAAELAHAAAIGVDFVALGPVLPSASHPGAPALGWDLFAELCAAAALPVYALGGMNVRDIARAREAGAHGIAGISAFWPKD